ncbi:MAG: ABC transporter ATP-binding protein [Actinobacteria bacterium]|nr:ABC transporter ATP-binding protein [Actinomycetota bacterium]
MDTVLRVEDLHKSYPSRWGRPPRVALRGLELEVPRGGVVGLLGPNGAGKTTTLKAVMGLVRPDRGRISLFGSQGSDPRARSRVGFLPEQPYFELYLTPRKILRYYGRLSGMSEESIKARSAHLLNLVGLGEVGDLTMEKFSKGMLQRVGLAQALLAEPELLILDEPSTGLDPLGKIEVRDLLNDLRRSGVTVLLSSHQLSEIEEICDRVAVISEGRNVASGALDELLRSRDEFLVRLAAPPPAGREPDLPPPAAWADDRTGVVVPREALGTVLRRLLDAGLEVEGVGPRRMSLEEFFLERVGRSGGDGK